MGEGEGGASGHADHSHPPNGLFNLLFFQKSVGILRRGVEMAAYLFEFEFEYV